MHASVAVIMLVHAFIKAFENALLTHVLLLIEEKAGANNLPDSPQYFSNLHYAQISFFRPFLWLTVEFVTLVPAAILAFHPTWRKVPLIKRLDLIFGFLLAGWVTLLSLGAQDPLNAPGGYNALVVIYLLALGLGYWGLRRKKEKAEEVFP